MGEFDSKRVLVFVAHPSDECQDLEAMTAPLRKLGVYTVLLSVTRGGDPGTCEQELRKEAGRFGVEVFFLDYPDGGLSEITRGKLIEHLAGWIDTVQPQTILAFGPDCCSDQPDHVTLFQVITQIVRQYFPTIPIQYLPSPVETLQKPVSPQSDTPSADRVGDGLVWADDRNRSGRFSRPSGRNFPRRS